MKMNNLTIIGNLVKKPELRTTQDGVSVCGFTVAVNRQKTKNNPDPGADFFNVNAWRGLGENCAKYLDKGRKVAVTGRVSLRTWEKDGKHGASLELNAEGVEFLNSRTAEQTAPVVDPSGMEVVSTDELPF
jgi:single-strand DNA-binding protein